MDKNYFSDITEVFIKAKKTENIAVNPHSKAAIREMLAYKIDEIQNAEPKVGFFSKWKYQLMGVPASLFAICLVVFAFQNLNIDMPGAEVIPETSEKEADIFGEQEIEDQPVIEDIPKPKPELMVIDYGETSQPTTPQTTTPKTGGSHIPPSYNQPIETVVETVAEAPAIVSTSPTYIEPEEATTEKKTAQSAQGYENNSNSGSSGSSTGTADESTDAQATSASNITTSQYEIDADTVNDMIQEDIKIETEDALETNNNVTVNEYRNPFSPLVTRFDTDILNTIEKPDNLSNVNVHYLNRDQVAVEVVDGDSTRWYMFEAVDGKWTLTQKFD